MVGAHFTSAEIVVIGTYYVLLGLLCLFGVHRIWLVFEHWALRRRDSPLPPAQDSANLPSATIQLPLYNEPLVCERLVEAISQFDYPHELLEIQVLDDSSDETTMKLEQVIERWQQSGVNIKLIRRNDRTGYKAGALQFGLQQSKSDLVAVFDADFVPKPDFLISVVGHFEDEKVGMVQTCWGHLNENASLLTRLQALFLNAHFHLEHEVRFRRGRFFNFNGTAGVWRRTAITDSGGWQHDTLTEDLDLSYRAQLSGWKFIYRRDIVSPAELPEAVDAYRSQQHRWSKGSMETARKILPHIWGADIPLLTKLDASLHLTANTAYLLLIALLLLMFPVFNVRESHGLYAAMGVDLLALFPTFIGFAVFFAASARATGRSWFAVLWLVPCAMALGVGLSLNNGFAALEGMMGRRTPFVRTMKSGEARNGNLFEKALMGGRGNLRQTLLPAVELLLGVYLVLLAATAVTYNVYVALPFVVLFALGFLGLAGANLVERFKRFVGSKNHAQRESSTDGEVLARAGQ